MTMDKSNMTNGDSILDKSNYDLALWLCELFSADDCNSRCPGWDTCLLGHKGLIDWMNQPAQQEEQNETP